MTPQGFVRGYIQAHEGVLSLDPDDSGNWHNGKLVGSKFGVTGDVLAAYRKVPFVTAADMKALTLDEAVQVGVVMFYKGPQHIDLLPWDQCIASVLDKAWGSGPGMAVKLLQREIGVSDDGVVGPFTVRAYRDYVASHGLEAAAKTFADIRNAYDEDVIRRRPVKAKYRNGWRNRTASFLPGTPWWKGWQAAA